LASFLAVSLNLDNFVLERDSATVIIALQDPSIILDWQHDHIICNIFSLIPVSFTWKARKVSRSANLCALYMANRAAVGFISNGIPSLSSPLFPFLFVVEKIPPPPPPPFSSLLVKCSCCLLVFVLNEADVTKKKKKKTIKFMKIKRIA
jgi:hypothetical protein